MKSSIVIKFFLYKKILLYFIKFILIFNLLESISYSENALSLFKLFEEPVEMNLNWKEYDKNRKKSFFYSTDVRKFDYGIINSGDVTVGYIGGIRILTLESLEDYQVIGPVRYNYMMSYRVIRCDNFTQNIINNFYNQSSRPGRYSSVLYSNGSLLSMGAIEYFNLDEGAIITEVPKKIKQKKLSKIVKKLCKDFFPNGTKINYTKEFLKEKKRQELIKNYKPISLIENLKHKVIYNENENVKYSFHENYVEIKSTFGKWTSMFEIKDDGYLYFEYQGGASKISEAFQVVDKKIVLWRAVDLSKFKKNNHYIYDFNNQNIINKSKKISNDTFFGRSMYAKGICCMIFRIDPMGLIFFDYSNNWKKFIYGDSITHDTAYRVKEKAVKFTTTDKNEIIFGPINLQTDCYKGDFSNLKDCRETFPVKLKIDTSFDLYFKDERNWNKWKKWDNKKIMYQRYKF
jgi:hypothetical protein